MEHCISGIWTAVKPEIYQAIIFIAFEFIVNVKGNFNQLIIYSFHGETARAMQATNYSWLMLYPCIYFFAIWDAYRDAGGGKKPFAYLPLVFSAFFTTVGLIYSSSFSLAGVFIGPVLLPMICMPIGLGIGAFIRWILLHQKNK